MADYAGPIYMSLYFTPSCVLEALLARSLQVSSSTYWTAGRGYYSSFFFIFHPYKYLSLFSARERPSRTSMHL